MAESQQRIELIEWSGDNLSFDPKWADEEPECKKGLLCEVLAVTFSGEVEGLKARQASPKTGQRAKYLADERCPAAVGETKDSFLERSNRWRQKQVQDVDTASGFVCPQCTANAAGWEVCV